MATSQYKNEPDVVSTYIHRLDPDVAKVIEALRKIILSADKEIGEHIKWNSPSFFFSGKMKPFDPKEYKRDLIVVNLHNKSHVLLVFPTGAMVNDTTGLLEGDYKDGRKLVKIMDLKDLKSKEKALRTVIKNWLKLVDK